MAGTTRVFIKGLPPSLTVEEFRKNFSRQAPITDSKLLPHRRIGYVGYRTSEDAERAVKYHNRSFIRMSKISVELARSVEEQQGRKLYPDQEIASAAFRRSRATEQDGSAGNPQSKRKREDETLEPEDERLREFLQVMQRPSNTKTWESQDRPLAVQESRDIQAATEKSREADSVAESTIRKRAKYQSESGPMIQSGAAQIQAVPVQDNTRVETEPSEEHSGEIGSQELSKAAPATSDEDWLRSRTSRLLGLVAPDDHDLELQRPHVYVEDSQSTETLRETDLEEATVPSFETKPSSDANAIDGDAAATAAIDESEMSGSRLFLRNLSYSATEGDLRGYFESHGYGNIEEIYLPRGARSDANKGYAHVQFSDPSMATRMMQALDQKPFMGRLVHILPSSGKTQNALDDFAVSRLPLKQQQQIKRKAEAASFTFNWNSLYMNTDAVMSSISERLGVAKSDLIDPTSSDAAVRQAHAETHVIQETKAYFHENGVDLDAFKTKARGDSAILVKNFPFETRLDELRDLFETFGPLKQLLMPPSGMIGIVEFEQADHARLAFGSLAYRKFKNSILFLEKAPKDLFCTKTRTAAAHGVVNHTGVKGTRPSTSDLLERNENSTASTSTLFVRNLNFTTTDERLREAFGLLDGFLSARVKTKPHPKIVGQTLSMGFGFLEFRSEQQAQAALAAMDGHKLDGHQLLIRVSQKSTDAADQRRKEDAAKKVARRQTKVIIKNLPFEASRKDIRSLFGAYGQLRSVRVPKKFDSSTRGFAFADFITAREAENAVDALKNTHLLGRRLVLEFAAADALDPEAEIEKMQQKVGKQADKVALQKLTGTGRKKFNIEGDDELDQL